MLAHHACPTRAAQQMADEFAAWLEAPDMGQVLPL